MTGTNEPSPPPNTAAGLEEYKNADEATRRLIERHMKRQHRVAMQPFYLQWAGILTGFAISLVCILAGIGLINGGHPWEGTLLSVADVAALAAVFVGARWAGRQD